MLGTVLVSGLVGLGLGIGVMSCVLSDYEKTKNREIRNLRTDRDDAKSEKSFWYNEYYSMKRQAERINRRYNDLVDEYNALLNAPKAKTPNVERDMMKKAVRIAMINSHPDKGGKADDFIAFKKLYDQFK